MQAFPGLVLMAHAAPAVSPLPASLLVHPVHVTDTSPTAAPGSSWLQAQVTLPNMRAKVTSLRQLRKGQFYTELMVYFDDVR